MKSRKNCQIVSEVHANKLSAGIITPTNIIALNLCLMNVTDLISYSINIYEINSHKEKTVIEFWQTNMTAHTWVNSFKHIQNVKKMYY